MEQGNDCSNLDNGLEEGELSAPVKRQPISLEELERKALKEKEESRVNTYVFRPGKASIVMSVSHSTPPVITRWI